MEKLTDNKSQSRLEIEVEGETVFATYRIDNNILYINYVEAPPSLRGTGAAGRLMEAVMEFAKENNFSVFPICGYAVSWINRHKEYHSLRA